MRNTLRRLLLLAAVSLGLWTFLLGAARADVNDFVINDFTADYYLNQNDPQGELRIVEHIKLTFSDNNHGILRALPEKYGGKSLKLRVNQVSSDTGAPAQFTTYAENDNLVLKIGDPNQTVTGAQAYTIDYSVQNVITFYDDHDELYWDINGDQWPQPFERVSVRFHLSSDLSPENYKCFTGAFGSTAQNCELSADGMSAVTTQALNPYETLTVVLAFPKGHFQPPTLADWWHDNYRKVLAVVLPPLLLGGWAYNRWQRHGKDLKGRGTIIAEYGPPEGLTPAEVGTVNAYGLNARDISATIIDLAIRKYLRIIEVTKKKILKDSKTYQFELLNPDFSGLKAHEQQVLNDLFPVKTIGETVTLDSLKNKFYKTIQSLQKELPKELTKAGYFMSNPAHAGRSLYVLAVILGVLVFVVMSWLSLGLLISAILVLIFAKLMPKRSALGVSAKEMIEGLNLYLTTAEKDRIKMLQSPDAPYAVKSTEPKKTVELFEKLLPYAMVLGVEGQWAKQFESIYKTPPDWYQGNWRGFNAVNFTSSLNSSVSAMGTSFSPPRSSSGSGFSGGGGSSGGGGGGGGGGGW